MFEPNEDWTKLNWVKRLCKCENASDVRPMYHRQAKLKIVTIFEINKNYEFLWLWMTKIIVIFLFTVVSRFWNSNTSAIEFVETTSKKLERLVWHSIRTNARTSSKYGKKSKTSLPKFCSFALCEKNNFSKISYLIFRSWYSKNSTLFHCWKSLVILLF